MICMKNRKFSSCPRAKVRRQGPPGSAKAQPWNLSGIWSGALVGHRSSKYCFSYCLQLTDKRQKATKIKSKCNKSITKQSRFLEYILLEYTFEFCKSAFAEKLKTFLKSTRRNLESKSENQTNSLFELFDYGIDYVTIDIRHQYGISMAEAKTSLLAKRP